MGHFGLFPIPLALGSQDIRGAGVSNAVIDPSVRNQKLPFQGVDTYSILPMIDQSGTAAFQAGIEVVLAFSSIPELIWRIAGFETLSLSFAETWHFSLAGLMRQYFRQFRRNALYSLPRAAGYAFGMAIMSILSGRRPISTKVPILLRNVDRFGTEFDELAEQFRLENVQTLTYARTSVAFNWRFASSRYGKFIVERDGKAIGAVVVLRADSRTRGPARVHDLFLIERGQDALPGVLEALRREFKNGFVWEHFPKSGLAKRYYAVAARSGVVRRSGFKSFLPGRSNPDALTHPIDIFFKFGSAEAEATRTRAALESALHFSPLFYVPCPYPSDNRAVH
ncbi:MAG: hypothetical protein JST04_13085 [Bdellovibrionales bacterium]|nr:hypothetical protein [Bdellovibrionales bacterium]